MDGSQRPTLNADLTYMCASGHAHIHICTHEHTYKGKEERNKGRGREGERESQTWPVIPALGKQKWKDQGFKAKLGYIVQDYPALHEILSQKGVGRDENDHLFLSHGNLILSETAVIFICVYQLIFPPLLVPSH